MPRRSPSGMRSRTPIGAKRCRPHPVAKQAMHVVHAVAEDPKHVHEAVESLEDPDASAEALRHVLVGGTPSVQAFASEVAEAEGGDQLPPHKATKIIGEVLAEIDAAH